MKTGVLSLLLLLSSLLPRDAFAVARHDRPRTRPITEGGKPKGVTITLTVHPETYQNVRIGLGRMKASIPAGTTDSRSYKRELGSGQRKGYLLARLGEQTGLTGQRIQLKYQVLYSKRNGLKPGMKVDVISAFFNKPTYFHIYGMFDGPVNTGDPASVITLP